jgi:hypothetical protein
VETGMGRNCSYGIWDTHNLSTDAR